MVPTEFMFGQMHRKITCPISEKGPSSRIMIPKKENFILSEINKVLNTGNLEAIKESY